VQHLGLSDAKCALPVQVFRLPAGRQAFWLTPGADRNCAGVPLSAAKKNPTVPLDMMGVNRVGYRWEPPLKRQSDKRVLAPCIMVLVHQSSNYPTYTAGIFFNFLY